MTSRGALGNEFSAFDDNGDAVIRVDLGFSYDPPCLQNNENVCGASPAVEPWAEARDPIGGTDDSDHALVFAHPSVRRLLAGHTFLADGAIEWQRCDGSPLGSIVSFRVWPPVSFRGEIPFHADAKQGEDVAYREGLAYVEAEQISSVWVWVDAHRRRVVGIELNAFDDTAMLDEQPNVRITKLDMIEEPQPAGGPDDADQCPEHEPGD